MTLVQSNSIADLISYLIFVFWTSVCNPIAGFFAFVSALFFGDYVSAVYEGIDFCQGTLL